MKTDEFKMESLFGVSSSCFKNKIENVLLSNWRRLVFIEFHPGYNNNKHIVVPSLVKRTPMLKKVAFLNFLNKNVFGPLTKKKKKKNHTAQRAHYYIASVFL